MKKRKKQKKGADQNNNEKRDEMRRGAPLNLGEDVTQYAETTGYKKKSSLSRPCLLGRVFLRNSRKFLSFRSGGTKFL